MNSPNMGITLLTIISGAPSTTASGATFSKMLSSLSNKNALYAWGQLSVLVESFATVYPLIKPQLYRFSVIRAVNFSWCHNNEPFLKISENASVNNKKHPSMCMKYHNDHKACIAAM
jgi:hypothetical protein